MTDHIDLETLRARIHRSLCHAGCDDQLHLDVDALVAVVRTQLATKTTAVAEIRAWRAYMTTGDTATCEAWSKLNDARSDAMVAAKDALAPFRAKEPT